jgi:hypothetical protein
MTDLHRMIKEPEIERNLGCTETGFWLFSKILPVYFTIYATVRGKLSDKSLVDALACVQNRHPLLRVRIVRCGWSSGRFESGNISEIPLRIIQENQDKLPAVMEEELSMPMLDDKGPLLRCVLIRHSDGVSTVMLTFHHSIGDAASGAFLIRDLISVAGQAQQGQHFATPALPPRQALDAYVPAHARGLRGRITEMKAFFRIAGSAMRHGLPAMPKPDKRVPVWKCKAGVVTHSLQTNFVEKIRNRARIEKTTLHGALSAAMIMAVINDRSSEKPLHLMLLSPVNLRSQLVPPVEEDVGLFVTMGFSLHLAGRGSDFWEMARHVRTSLTQCINKGEPFGSAMRGGDVIPLIKLMGTGKAGAKAATAWTAFKTANSFTLSNLGNVAITSDHGAFKILSIGFAAPVPSSFGSFVATIDGHLIWNFVGMDPLCTKNHISSIADSAVRILIENLS